MMYAPFLFFISNIFWIKQFSILLVNVHLREVFLLENIRLKGGYVQDNYNFTILKMYTDQILIGITVNARISALGAYSF